MTQLPVVTRKNRVVQRSRLLNSVQLLLMLLLCSSCATNGSFSAENVKNTFQDLGRSVGNGFSKLTSRGPGKNSQKSNEAALIATRFQSDQVPNILLKKPVAEGELTSGFGYRLSPKGIPLPKKHQGVDYAAAEGTEVYAAGDGVIEKLYFSKSYGNRIELRHNDDFVTTYSHLKFFAAGLSTGSVVKKGQIIGAIGTTGSSTSAHLHYELLYKGRFIDPLLK